MPVCRLLRHAHQKNQQSLFPNLGVINTDCSQIHVLFWNSLQAATIWHQSDSTDSQLWLKWHFVAKQAGLPHSLFKIALSTSLVRYRRIINRKYYEREKYAYFNVLSQCLRRGTEENRKQLTQDRESNQKHQKYEGAKTKQQLWSVCTWPANHRTETSWFICAILLP